MKDHLLQIRASICRDNFYEFVKEFWYEVCPETPVFNWHIQYLCDEAQQVAERVFAGLPKLHDLIVNVPPGSTKSIIFSRMLPAWIWTRMPSARIITASYATDLSLELADDSRDLIKSAKYQTFFPEVEIRKDRDNKSNYKTGDKGGRLSASTGSRVTGFHGHFLIADDLINPQDAEAVSGANVRATNDWLDRTYLSRKVDKSITPLILIMQRLHEDDPTGHLLAKEGKNIRHICLPGEETEFISPPELRERYVDGLLDPVRFPRDVLKEMLLDLGQYGYAGQVLQQPTPPEGGMFKVKEILAVDRLPSPIVREIRYWDKAGTDRRKNPNACYTAGVKLAELRNGNFCVMDVVRGQWGTHEREQTIKETAEKDGTACTIYIEQEPGSGGKESAESTIKNLAGWTCYADRPTGEKVVRADPFSAQVNIGNVCMLKADWNGPFIEELKHYPVSKFKDQADAAAGAFNKLWGGKRVGVWGSGRR